MDEYDLLLQTRRAQAEDRKEDHARLVAHLAAQDNDIRTYEQNLARAEAVAAALNSQQQKLSESIARER